MKKRICVIPMLVLVCFAAGCQDRAAIKDQNKALATRFVDAYQKGDIATIRNICSPDFIEHGLGQVFTLEQAIEILKGNMAIFSGFTMIVEDMIAEGDKVAVRYLEKVTHTGEGLGIPATGKKAETTGIEILRFENGKIAEAWTAQDVLGLLMQVGFELKPKEEKKAEEVQDTPKMPKIEPLFDYPLRDTSVCQGPEGAYYLTGTTGSPTWWHTNEGIRVWKSKDLKEWEPLGLVWSFAENATWQKGSKDEKGAPLRAIWAPEIHFFKGTFWIAYCVNYGGTGILKSASGKAEGPYIDVKPDGPLTAHIDASLFCDDDAAVYFLWQNGMIARLKDDLSGLAEEPRHLKPANAGQVGFEGAFLAKIDGRYHLICADFNKHDQGPDSYDCMAADSGKIYGPYGDRYLAIPHGGHNMLFKDRQGEWWSTIFGNGPEAPFLERPGILRIDFDAKGRIRPKL
jgi:xylan 1,4-beta-xylosidase